MLPQEYRLAKKIDFSRILRRGESFYNSLFNIKISPNRRGVSRFGFIVSNKVSKKAVVRNRIRRLLREIIKEKLSEIKTGYDIIFFTKPEIVGKNELSLLRQEVLKLLQKANLIDGKKDNS